MFTATTTFAASERLALVSSEKDNSVTVFDLLAEKTVKVLPTGKVPHAMAASPSGKIFVNNRGSKKLTVIDANTMTVAATIPLPATSFQLALAPDGKTLAVVYQDALKLSLVDVATNEILRTVEIGEIPADFKGAAMKHPAWSPDGNYVYCPESVGRTIVKIEAATGTVVKKIALKVGNHYPHPHGSLFSTIFTDMHPHLPGSFFASFKGAHPQPQKPFGIFCSAIYITSFLLCICAIT